MGTGQILKEVYIKKVEETIKSLDDFTGIDALFIEQVLRDSIKWYYKNPPKKQKEILSEDWVEYKKEKPLAEAYYQTKVGDEYISDWWNGRYFTFNDNLLTHWKRR